MKEKTLSSKKVYTCSFMDLYEDEVILPNQKRTGRVYIKHPGAAAILPIDSKGNIILTRQFRYPIHAVSLEIPAGKKDDLHEDPKDCAIRELEEETGYVSSHVEHLVMIYPCLGYSDEIIDLFIAKDCRKIEHPKPQDEDECVETVLLTVEEAKNLIKNHQIHDGKTIIALQHYFLFFSS